MVLTFPLIKVINNRNTNKEYETWPNQAYKYILASAVQLFSVIWNQCEKQIVPIATTYIVIIFNNWTSSIFMLR